MGCGNGRLAHALDHAGYTLDYLGIDGSTEFITLARQSAINLHHLQARFVVSDITEAGWTNALSTQAQFDTVVALAVLHHIPSQELRVQVLCQLKSLLKTGGTLILSNWQFTRSERLRNKIVPWDTLGIDESALEANDFLLDWKRGGIGYRYVHLITPAEMESLADAAGLRLITQFDADADLNLLVFSVRCNHPIEDVRR